MPGTGAHNMLPMSFGGDDIEGWRAEHHARICADLAAASRALPVARLTFSRGATAGDLPTITKYRGRPADVVANNPVLTGTAAPPSAVAVVVTWPVAPIDELGNKLQLNITGAKFYRHATTARAKFDLTAPNVITITPEDANAFSGTLVVYGKWGDYRIEKYGGDPDKHDSETETVPYSWIAYQELTSAYGSAYGDKRTGLVHAEKLAYARGLASVERAEDRRRANSTPGTSDIKLEDWAKCLRVSAGTNEPRWRIRRRCAAMYAAQSGQNLIDLETAIRDLLGDAFVAIRTFGTETPHGDWPDKYDLGGGVWATVRSRILVEVIPPADAADQEFRKLIQVELIDLLDRLCPGHVAFDWTTTTEAGFLLGISRLSIDGL